MITLLQSSHYSLPKVGKKQIDTAEDLESVLGLLMFISSRSEVVSKWFILMPLDVWKEVKGFGPIQAMLYERSGFCYDYAIITTPVLLESPDFCVGRLSIYIVIYNTLLLTPMDHHIAPIATDTLVRPTCFFETYYTRPLKNEQVFVMFPVTSEGHLWSQFRPSKSTVLFEQYMSRVIMLLNSSNCASHMRIVHLPFSHRRRNFNHLNISYQTTFLSCFRMLYQFLLGAFDFS
ncbi:hypothetical protein TNCV_2831831 [Trichonephila clavipes]|nr:hypothetical protein TNCV_2831831 [Trichonephila clavipes]